MKVLTNVEGWLMIIAYFAMVMTLAYFYGRKDRKRTKLSFLVANRTISGWQAAFSIAATWIWAPALFLAAEKAFTQGIAGVFWFTVPNVLTLVIFGFFATWMRKKLPEGFTFSDFIREKFSNRTHNLYLTESFGLQIMSFGVQLLAGGAILHKLTGISFFWITVCMAVIPFIYTYLKGIKASIMTDYWQMMWIAIVLLLGLPFIFSNAGADTVWKGLSGATGEFGSLFGGKSFDVFLAFGIPVTIGLLSGPFGDQMFWQRVFSIRKGEVKKAMFRSSLIFAIVPISLAIFGFAYAGSGLENVDTQLTNVQAAIAFAPKWFLWLFMFMILSGLISTADSIICAVSSIAGHDLIMRSKHKLDSVKVSRLAMILVTVLAVVIANSGITILYLFLIYGILRSSVLIPTVYAVKGIGMSEKGLFYGILTSILVGLPIFAYGKLTGNLTMILIGSFVAVLASGIISRFGKNKIYN